MKKQKFKKLKKSDLPQDCSYTLWAKLLSLLFILFLTTDSHKVHIFGDIYGFDTEEEVDKQR